MITKLMLLFNSNQVQIFKYSFQGSRRLKVFFPQKEGIEVSISFKEEIQVRTIKIHSLKKPTRRLLEDM